MGETPSSFDRRLPAALVALFGCAVAAYLGFYQAGLVRHVWEPFFGDGSARILGSSVARLLPVPDALIGAAAYFVEFVLELVGDETRARSRPLLTALNVVLVVGMAVASLGLIAAQGFVFDAWCTLCLVSACCSFAVAALGYPEIRVIVEALLHASA